MNSVKLILNIILILLTKLSYSQAGALDKNFGILGTVTTKIGAHSEGNSLAVQSDGKIVVAGYSSSGSETKDSNDFFAVARYNIDGSLDNTFSNDGILTTDFSNGEDQATSLAIQTDGKIIAVGHAKNGKYFDYAMVRYNKDGSLDSNFGINGKIISSFGLYDDKATSVTIQADGKIIVGGYFNVNKGFANYDYAIARYHMGGTLDSTFNFDGKVTTNHLIDDEATSLKLQKDGKIILSGYSHSSSTDQSFVLLRYEKDGSLDSNFGSKGIVKYVRKNYIDYATSLAIQLDEKIIVAGYSHHNSYPDGSKNVVIKRYNNDGSLDTTFVNALYDFYNKSSYIQSLVIQLDGKIIVSGRASVNSDYDLVLARLNSNGSLDKTFSNDGMVNEDIDQNDCANSMVIQSDGKILVGGYTTSGVFRRFALARFFSTSNGKNVDLTLDNSILIYPNPNNGNFTIEIENPKKNISIEVYNMMGELVKKIKSTEKVTAVNLNTANGIYLVRVKNMGVVWNQKLVVSAGEDTSR